MTELVATIVPQFVYEPKPGKESGKLGPAGIKTANGDRFSFWTRDIPLQTFSPGNTYQVAFTEEERNGYLNRYIKRVLDSQSRPIQQPPKSQPKQFRSSMDPSDALAAATTLILAAFVQAGKVGLSTTEIALAKATIKQGLSAEEKPVHIQKSEAEFDDEIPGF